MLRIRQRYWFCLAAVCLVGSLIMLWSTDIDIAESVAEKSAPLPAEPVFRSLDELPTGAAFSDQSLSPLRLDHVAGGPEEVPTRIQAPATIAGRLGSPLNSTARVIPATDVMPANYQQTNRAVPESVWLSGNIEILEPTR